MTGAGRAAINIAIFRRSGELLTTRCAGDIAAARGKSLENRIELPNDFFEAANHHAVTAFQAPNAAAGANIHVVNAFFFELLRAADVIFKAGIAAVNDNVARLHPLGERSDSLLWRTSRGNHEPSNARFA